MIFSELAIAWIKYKEDYVKRSSISAYSLLIQNHLIPAFCESTVIQEEDVQSYLLNKVKGGLSQKTVKDTIIVLKMVLKYGVKNGVWASIPTFEELIFPTNNHDKSIKVMNADGYVKISDHLKNNFSYLNLGILIALRTGIRIGEVCGLKWSDIDIETGSVTINRSVQRIYISGLLNGKKNYKENTEIIVDTPKTKCSQRNIPLSADVLKIITAILGVIKHDDYFIISNTSKPIEPRKLRTYQQALFADLGIPKIKFHGLRHTFATKMIGSKADIKTVSSILGHANITTTLNLYVHPGFDQKKEAIDHLFQ